MPEQLPLRQFGGSIWSAAVVALASIAEETFVVVPSYLARPVQATCLLTAALLLCILYRWQGAAWAPAVVVKRLTRGELLRQ